MKSIGVNHFLNEYPFLNWDICPELSKLMFLCNASYPEKKLIEGNLIAKVFIHVFVLESTGFSLGVY